MKRGTPDHPKTRLLAIRLSLRRYQAVGILESLWHFTAAYAKRGDIGKWTDSEIATAIDWEGEPETLIAALVDCHLLDRCQIHRLLVHDWKEHADQTVQRSEEVKKLGFASIQLGKARRKLANASQPAPEPMPKPEPSMHNNSEADGFDRFWSMYPKKVGKTKAKVAYAKCLAQLGKEDRGEGFDPISFLIKKVIEFAGTPKGHAGIYCPHPTTWLNEGRYDDDPEAWQEKEKRDNDHSSYAPDECPLAN